MRPPALGLAQRAGPPALMAEHVRLHKPGGVNVQVTVPALVAEIFAGADSTGLQSMSDSPPLAEGPSVSL